VTGALLVGFLLLLCSGAARASELRAIAIQTHPGVGYPASLMLRREQSPTPIEVAGAPVPPQVAAAEPPQLRPRPELVSPIDRDYLLNYPRGAWEIVKRPFDFSRDALITDAVVLGVGGVLFALDREIRVSAGRVGDSEEHNAITRDLEPIGRWQNLGIGFAASYAAGIVTDDTRLQRLGLLGGQALALATIPYVGLNYAFSRDRPTRGHGSVSFFKGNGSRSFPSGHATYSMAAATVIAEEFKDYPWVAPFAYGVAGAVGISRIVDDKHWASDVWAGWAIGFGVGKLVYAMDPFGLGKNVAILPITEPGVYGAQLHMTF